MPDAHHDVSSSTSQGQAPPAVQPHSSPQYEGFDPDLPERPRTTATTVAAEAPKKAVLGGLSSVQVSASALAAVTSALAASFFGVAGTLIGAAVGSMVSTIAGAMYAESMRRAGARIKDAQTVVLQKIPVTQAHDPADVPSTTALTTVGEAPNDETVVLDVDAAQTSVMQPATDVPGHEPTVQVTLDTPEAAPDDAPKVWWRRPVFMLPIVGVAGFVIAIGVIVGSELIIGHPVSGGTGGTSLSQLTGGTTTKKSPDTPRSTPATQESTATGTPSAEPTTSSTPSASSTSEPSATVTSEPSATQTSQPSTTSDADEFSNDSGSALGGTSPTTQPAG